MTPTLLPEPVVPPTRRCGISARSATVGLPSTFFPSVIGSTCVESRYSSLVEEIAEPDGLPRAVRDLDADDALAGNRRDDPDAERLHRHGDVVGERRDLRDLHARAGLVLEDRDHGTRPDRDDLTRHAEVLELLLEDVREALEILLVDLRHLEAVRVEEAHVRELERGRRAAMLERAARVPARAQLTGRDLHRGLRLPRLLPRARHVVRSELDDAARAVVGHFLLGECFRERLLGRRRCGGRRARQGPRLRHVRGIPDDLHELALDGLRRSPEVVVHHRRWIIGMRCAIVSRNDRHGDDGLAVARLVDGRGRASRRCCRRFADPRRLDAKVVHERARALPRFLEERAGGAGPDQNRPGRADSHRLHARKRLLCGLEALGGELRQLEAERERERREEGAARDDPRTGGADQPRERLEREETDEPGGRVGVGARRMHESHDAGERPDEHGPRELHAEARRRPTGEAPREEERNDRGAPGREPERLEERVGDPRPEGSRGVPHRGGAEVRERRVLRIERRERGEDIDAREDPREERELAQDAPAAR